MELTNINQIDFQDFRTEKIDCLLSTVGVQNRCLYLAEKMADLISEKILLIPGNDDQKANIYLQRFNDLGFVHFKADEKERESLDQVLGIICNIKKSQINVAVDYSCMPKRWYALFIDFITRNPSRAERINLFLSYTPKIFESLPEKSAVDYFGPLIFNRDNLNDKKPVSMIISLDHNGGSLYEAINKVRPSKLLAFVPNCSHDPDYSKIVRAQNVNLLEQIDPNNIIEYESDQPEEINTLLTSRCLDERINSEVVIVPQGPKTFSIISMLLSVRYPDIKLWEIIFRDQVTSAHHGEAAATPVIVKVSFINDELD